MRCLSFWDFHGKDKCIFKLLFKINCRRHFACEISLLPGEYSPPRLRINLREKCKPSIWNRVAKTLPHSSSLDLHIYIYIYFFFIVFVLWEVSTLEGVWKSKLFSEKDKVPWYVASKKAHQKFSEVFPLILELSSDFHKIFLWAHSSSFRWRRLEVFS